LQCGGRLDHRQDPSRQHPAQILRPALTSQNPTYESIPIIRNALVPVCAIVFHLGLQAAGSRYQDSPAGWCGLCRLNGLSGVWLMYFGLIVLRNRPCVCWCNTIKPGFYPCMTCMARVSEMIWQTCKDLSAATGQIPGPESGFCRGVHVLLFPDFGASQLWHVAIILAASCSGSQRPGRGGVGSASASTPSPNSRTAFSPFARNPLVDLGIPLRSGMSVGLLLGASKLVFHDLHFTLCPARPGRTVLHRVLPSANLSVGGCCASAGGIFTKIADIGSDLMKIISNAGG